MLVLTRKSHEQIQIGDNITITILRVKGGAIRVGIDAPKNVTVLRKELAKKPLDSDKTKIEAAAAAELVKSTATSSSRRRRAEGAASILAGGKTKALDACLANHPRKPRATAATAPLAGFLMPR